MLRRFGNKSVPEIFEIGSYRFIPRKRLLAVRDEELKLSLKESDLFNILCTYPNEVMPRRKALKEIWQNDARCATRTTDVYVAKLRKRFVHDSRIQIQTFMARVMCSEFRVKCRAIHPFTTRIFVAIFSETYCVFPPTLSCIDPSNSRISITSTWLSSTRSWRSR